MELPDYNFEFSNSPAIREIVNEATNEWNDCKRPNADNIICALTEQQKLMVNRGPRQHHGLRCKYEHAR